MKKLIAIGEALIDFITNKSCFGIGEVESFFTAVGGAPAKVCGAFTKLGGKSSMITQLGDDAFGDKIVKELANNNIDVSYILRTDKANTCLAFVSLKEDGNREFSFYRNPSADMLLKPEDIKEEWFEDCYAFHFCSVSLGDYPMKDAHKKALEYAAKKGLIISFDPNIRLPLWKDHEKLKQRVLEFLPFANIIKISDEELEFITGCKTIQEAKEILFKGNVELIIYTKGAEGAEAYTKKVSAFSEGEKVKAVDTTGAGDAFIGSFLAQMCKDNITSLKDLTQVQLEKYLDYSNKYCGYSVMGRGAIASYATAEQMEKLL